MPVGGTTHSSVLNGRSTSCGYHHESSCTAPTGRPRASRSSTAATTVDAASRPGSVRYQYALPLSVQYDKPRAEHVGVAHGRRNARRRSQEPRPLREAIARAVARDDRELGREAGVDVVDVAVPARAQSVVGLLPAGRDRRSPARGTTAAARAAACGRRARRDPSGMTTGGRIGSSRQRDSAASLNTGNANSVYWCPNARRPSGAPPAARSERIEVPRDRRRRELAGREAAAAPPAPRAAAPRRVRRARPAPRPRSSPTSSVTPPAAAETRGDPRHPG